SSSSFIPSATPCISTLSLHDALPILKFVPIVSLPVMEISRRNASILLLAIVLLASFAAVSARAQQVGADYVVGTGDSLNIQVYRSEEHTSELQSRENLVCRLLLEKKK